MSLATGRSEFELVPTTHRSWNSLRHWRNERYSELLSGRDLALPGVHDTLAQLATSTNMAVVTSSRRDHFHLISLGIRPAPLLRFHPLPGRLPRSETASRAVSAGPAVQRPERRALPGHRGFRPRPEGGQGRRPNLLGDPFQPDPRAGFCSCRPGPRPNRGTAGTARLTSGENLTFISNFSCIATSGLLYRKRLFELPANRGASWTPRPPPPDAGSFFAQNSPSLFA